MVFNSLSYFLFLSTITALWWTVDRKNFRLWLIFTGSLIFYGLWRYEFVALILFSLAVDFAVGIRLQDARDAGVRRFLLALSFVVNLGLLFFFKYLNFGLQNIEGISWVIGRPLHLDPLNIILPLGISFSTFQSLSYTVDVYRRRIPAEKNFALYGAYVLFFPQLIAGPILRAGEVIWQLDKRPPFDPACFAAGLKRILMGVFLKVVLADNLSPLADSAFATAPEYLSSLDVWVSAFLFGLQIYFDFSAYSHIALGSALLMGIRFPENFEFPYSSASPREFWRRWHISLSSWIRDYLYLPLKGVESRDDSRGGLGIALKEKVNFTADTRALFVTWAIMGLWHGARWNFVFWGLWHATLIFAFRQVKKTSLLVTLPLIMLSWIFFRCATSTQAFALYSKLFLLHGYTWMGLHQNFYVVAFCLTAAVLIANPVGARLLPVLRKRPALFFAFETTFFIVVITFDIIFLRPISQYIYFQF